MPPKSATYDTSVEIAAPIMPYGGIRITLSATLIAAATPETTQLSCVRLARPEPIAITVYAAYAVAANASGATASAARRNSGFGARTSTSHGARAPSARATHEQMTTR